MKYILKLLLFLTLVSMIGCSSFHYVKTADPQVSLSEIIAAGESENQELTVGLGKLLEGRVISAVTFSSEKTIETIIALQKLSPEFGKLEFIELLKDKDEEVRYHSADALGNIRENDVIPALILSTKDKDEIVSDAASRSLSKLTLIPIHKENEDNLSSWKEWWEANKKYFSSSINKHEKKE